MWLRSRRNMFQRRLVRMINFIKHYEGVRK